MKQRRKAGEKVTETEAKAPTDDAGAEGLLREIEAFIEKWGITQTSFGILAINDSKLVPRLRNGTDVLTNTGMRCRAFMRGYEAGASRGAK